VEHGVIGVVKREVEVEARVCNRCIFTSVMHLFAIVLDKVLYLYQLMASSLLSAINVHTYIAWLFLHIAF